MWAALMLLILMLRVHTQAQPQAQFKFTAAPRQGTEFVSNEGYQLVKNLGSLYLVDLTGETGGFEDRFARKMTGSDKDTIVVTVTGEDFENEDVFATMKSMVEKRYTPKMLKHDYLTSAHGGVKSSEAGIWFFLYGVASTAADQTESIDASVAKLLLLAESAVIGKAFYPKQTVLDLMEGSLTKMHPDLAPLMRKLGYITIEKGLAYQANGGTPLQLDSADVFISAEYFQFWTELSVFVFNNMPKDNILIQPMTIMSTKKCTVQISNINTPSGGPLLLPQFEALRGFLEAKAQQRLPVNLQNTRIKQDYIAFFSGFCKRQTRDSGNFAAAAPVSVSVSADSMAQSQGQSQRLFLGKRHINAPIRVQEFRFLVEAFRALKTSVTELTAKFSNAIDVVSLLPPSRDTYEEYDKFDLITEMYISPEVETEDGSWSISTVDAFIEDL